MPPYSARYSNILPDCLSAPEFVVVNLVTMASTGATWVCVQLLATLLATAAAPPAARRAGRFLFGVPEVRSGGSDSPIYYIRLPAAPYAFVPGLGFVSQPAAPPAGPGLLNLPLPFLGNGRPVTVYRWSGSPAHQLPTAAPPPAPDADSTVQRVPGRFTFNGKPNELFVLRDSYNSLYDDALQNLYP